MKKAKPKKKKKFGIPQRKYCQEKELCREIRSTYFSMRDNEWFDDRKINSALHDTYGVPISTLYRWTRRWDIDPHYDPSDSSVHGIFHRIFNDEQEQSVVDYIDSNYMSPGNYFSGVHFQGLIFEAYDEIYGNQENPPPFSCSSQFIQDFKYRHQISSKKAHFRQRPSTKSEDQIREELQTFKTQIISLIQSVKNSNEPVINCDETGFQIMPTSIQTWAFKKSKNVIVNVNDNLKDRISVMASITSNNEKLPLFFISKADNEDNANEQLGELINNNQFTYSSSSFMNSDCMVKYLNFLRNLYPNNQKIHLILDSYSSHTSQICKNTAQELNIDLYFIPSHFTDLMQPLDIALFALLKSIANAKIRKLLFGIENKKIGMPKSVLYLQQAWQELPTSTIERAWEQYL